jgi:hypothetical protein
MPEAARAAILAEIEVIDRLERASADMYSLSQLGLDAVCFQSK